MQTYKHNKRARAAGLFLVLLSLLAGCASRGAAVVARPPELRPPAEQDVRVVALQSPAALPSPALIRRMAALDLAISDYPLPGVQQQRWRFEARGIELLARQGYPALAERRLNALLDQVRSQSRSYFQLQARRYLQQAEQFAFLDAAQRRQLNRVALQYYRKDYRQAYYGGRTLVRALWSADRWLTVRPGETLASIAARADVYDNPNLWPLLQQANKGLVRHPRRLKAGWRLRYPVHPKLDEIFAAVQLAQTARP